MNSFCGACGAWSVGRVELHGDRGRFRCTACGEQIERAVFPLLVVTGTSGAGKTTVAALLRVRLKGRAAVFEKDWMWARDKPEAYNNFFRIASDLAAGGVATVLVGTSVPEHLNGLADRDLVGEIAYLNLHCDDEERARRLRARPAWRESSSPEFVERHRVFAQWLLDHAATDFGRPMPTVDTGTQSVGEVVEAVAGWVEALLADLRDPVATPVLHNVTLYVSPDRFARVRSFHSDVVGLEPVFEETGHISCLAASGDGTAMALCVHEADPGHPAGTRELFFWVDDAEAPVKRAEALGHATDVLQFADGRSELLLIDPEGNRVRLHRAR